MNQETKDLFLNFLGEIEHVTGDRYHFDTWNDLMRVVEKIEEFNTLVCISKNTCSIDLFELDVDRNVTAMISISKGFRKFDSKIEAVTNACIHFINFHNGRQKGISN
jgi:hypothetical protein